MQTNERECSVRLLNAVKRKRKSKRTENLLECLSGGAFYHVDLRSRFGRPACKQCSEQRRLDLSARTQVKAKK
jgi:hypothetical protein